MARQMPHMKSLQQGCKIKRKTESDKLSQHTNTDVCLRVKSQSLRNCTQQGSPRGDPHTHEYRHKGNTTNTIREKPVVPTSARLLRAAFYANDKATSTQATILGELKVSFAAERGLG